VSIPSHSKSVIDPDVPKFEAANLVNYDFAKYGTPAVRDGLIKRWTEQVFPLPK
jgi:iron(III) transport system substrate-binding protein